MENYSYFFFLRMDENYNTPPHGVNFQDAIFADVRQQAHLLQPLPVFQQHPREPFFPRLQSGVRHTGGQQGSVLQPSPSQSRAGQRHGAGLQVEGLGVPQLHAGL
ncbi:uncharacterized protein LOC144383349 [Gasterosteus aculeatus]